MIKTVHLLHALLLSRHGSFRKAAEEANLSHPAFSRSIANLEVSLGVKLFDRLSSGVEPTVYGHVLLRRAKDILWGVEDLEREIQLLEGLDFGEFRIAMGLYAADLAGYKSVGRIVREHPELHIKVSIFNSNNFVNALLEQTVDIAYSETSFVDGNNNFVVEKLGEHRFVFFCRQGHPLVGKPNLRPSELSPYPTALTMIPKRAAAVFPGKFFPCDLEGCLSPSVEVESIGAICSVVAESDALGVACPIQIEEELRRGSLVALPIQEGWMRLSYGLISKRGRSVNPVSDLFRREVLMIESEVAARNEELFVEFLKGAGGA
jgi:DNA-binding transcriptional LysR family regulator